MFDILTYCRKLNEAGIFAKIFQFKNCQSIVKFSKFLLDCNFPKRSNAVKTLFILLFVKVPDSPERTKELREYQADNSLHILRKIFQRFVKIGSNIGYFIFQCPKI